MRITNMGNCNALKAGLFLLFLSILFSNLVLFNQLLGESSTQLEIHVFNNQQQTQIKDDKKQDIVSTGKMSQNLRPIDVDLKAEVIKHRNQLDPQLEQEDQQIHDKEQNQFNEDKQKVKDQHSLKQPELDPPQEPSIKAVPRSSGSSRLLYNISALEEPDVVETLLAFMHVPKASGGSFKAYLCDIHKANSNGMTWFPACFASTSAHAEGCGPCPWGATHCSYNEMQQCLETGRADFKKQKFKRNINPGDRPLWTTVFRDPVERVISEWFWWKGYTSDCKKHHQWGKELCQVGKKGMKAWVQSEYNFAHNRQSRYITMKGDPAPINKNYNLLNGLAEPQWECSAFFTIYGEHFWKQIYGVGFTGGLVQKMNQNETWLQEVKDVVDNKFFFAGIQEKYDPSLDLFVKMMERKFNKSFKRPSQGGKSKYKMHSSSKGKVDDETRRIIREKNKVDIALYLHVKQRFEEAQSIYGVS